MSYTLICKRRHLYLNPSGSRIYVGGPTGNCVLTAYGLKRETERKAFEEIYNNDELYARFFRARYGVPILDELPEGWYTELAEYGRRGLRGSRDHESRYVWAENMPPYRVDTCGFEHKNKDHHLALVPRERS